MVVSKIDLPELFLDGETRNGYYISPEMKKVWAVQLKLLNKLLEVCKKHGIKVWAEAGTLLGTIRHKGYNPWDDAIDMVLLRPDYDKLVQLAAAEFTHPYFFQCGYTEKYYPRGHAQLRMDGTSAIGASPAFMNTHQGVFIDIFPYDAVPDNVQEREIHIKKRNKLYDKMLHAGRFDILHPIRSLKLVKYRNHFDKLLQEFEDNLRKYSVGESEGISCLAFNDDLEIFLRKKQWYEETLYMPFENMLMPVPVGYHEILTKQYGDYMTPVKAPSLHVGFWKLDAETDYKSYMPEYRKLCRKWIRQSYFHRIKDLFKRLKH